MSDFSITISLGSHLTEEELSAAAALLSKSYTRWQNNPNNLNPVTTDTSPAVYADMMRKTTHEVLLYYEKDTLCAVFVHSLSPEYDRYPLRKLSYLGVLPQEKGYEKILRIFTRYTEFVEKQGEDVIIASDLDQATLNTLLENAGFREIVDRNETIFLLSQLLQRKIFSFQKVNGDFVIDQIITLDGKAVRRGKKLYKLQTTPYDFFSLYCQQQQKRTSRSLTPEQRDTLRASLSDHHPGICFISSFTGTISLEDESQEKFNSARAIMGHNYEDLPPEVIDAQNNILYLLPATENEFHTIADNIDLRPGFYDFLFFCLKMLGSYYIISSATPYQVTCPLERTLATSVPLRYMDLVERIFTPEVTRIPGSEKTLSDNTSRTAYQYSGPYVDFSSGKFEVRKDMMIEHIHQAKGDTPTPIIFLASNERDKTALQKLFEISLQHKQVVLVLDFGSALSRWFYETCTTPQSPHNPYFSIMNIRDFYQIPVLLEAMGLRIQTETDFL